MFSGRYYRRVNWNFCGWNEKGEELKRRINEIISNNHRLALWETVIYLYFMDERGRLKQVVKKALLKNGCV